MKEKALLIFSEEKKKESNMVIITKILKKISFCVNFFNTKRLQSEASQKKNTFTKTGK